MADQVERVYRDDGRRRHVHCMLKQAACASRIGNESRAADA
ncbi:hypothetical protein GGR75_001485 [Xanthomonas campestris]|nr:hypothetical protein [Xanthomonas campestris]